MLIDLSKRSNQPELMDDFSGGIESLRIVFDDINRVNSILGGNKITINAVRDLIEKHPQENYSIVDMGCGDGNMLRELAQYFRKRNIKVQLIGIDMNGDALQLAKKASKGFPEIEYQLRNILEMQKTDLYSDIIINTLFMHHFVNKELPHFLEKINQSARIGIIINDLHRSRLAYYLYKAFSLIFIKTETAKVDGLISIKRGFIKSDLIKYAESLPEFKHDIRWKWAFRYVWIMQPNRLT